jgi:nucleoside triphosphate diphosphatase
VTTPASASAPGTISAQATLDDLLAIMARLRDPQGGCPWDLAQDFRSILPYTLEEAYEVAEAIEEDDMPELRDELGDLLFQVVFHARMAEERGSFGFVDVVAGICAKMLRRHPHVFGDADLADESAVGAHWEREKAAERARRNAGGAGALAGVAQALPALLRAEKLQRRAARVGFDWDSVDGVLVKVEEELQECREVLAAEEEPSRRVHEVGDLLFSCVNLARHLGVDAEQALRAANHRFEGRFAAVERGLAAEGKAPGPEVRADMERLWERAKAAE